MCHLAGFIAVPGACKGRTIDKGCFFAACTSCASAWLSTLRAWILHVAVEVTRCEVGFDRRSESNGTKQGVGGSGYG